MPDGYGNYGKAGCFVLIWSHCDAWHSMLQELDSRHHYAQFVFAICIAAMVARLKENTGPSGSFLFSLKTDARCL